MTFFHLTSICYSIGSGRSRSPHVEPDPKIDHVVEIEEKLDELQMDASEPVVKERIERARKHCLSYLRETTF